MSESDIFGHQILRSKVDPRIEIIKKHYNGLSPITKFSGSYYERQALFSKDITWIIYGTLLFNFVKYFVIFYRPVILLF